MALAYEAVHVTRDVDAVFIPKNEVCRASRAMAEDFGLPQATFTAH